MRVRLEKQFNYEHLSELKRPANDFLSNKYACKFESKDYVPGENVFSREGGVLNLNVWTAPTVEAIEGDCSTILAHFDYMFSDPEVRQHWINCFASMVQNPSKKLKHCLLLIGRQGTGKSYFKHLLGLLLGKQNIGLIDSGEWQGSFNAHILNVQAAIIEELMASGRLEAYNELKRYLTEPFVTANEKHVAQYQARTPYMFLAFSNHRKPILLEETDRRFHVFHSPVEPQGSDYYDKLFTDTGQQVGAFLFHLQNVDLEHFSPDASPPMTDSKKELIKLSKKPSESALKELIDSGNRPFHRDLVTMEECEIELRMKGGISERALQSNSLKETLLDLKALPLGQKRVDGHRYSLWAIRNAAKWADASTDSIKEEFSK